MFFSAAFLQAIHAARLEPTKKYSHPQTEAQEIGWMSSPLVSLSIYLSKTENDFDSLNV